MERVEIYGRYRQAGRRARQVPAAHAESSPQRARQRLYARARQVRRLRRVLARARQVRRLIRWI